MLSRLAVSGYRLRDTYDITSYLSLEAMDSLLPYLDMDLSEFISGLPSMEWHPSGNSGLSTIMLIIAVQNMVKFHISEIH